MPTDSTSRAAARPGARRSPWVPAAGAAALGWALLVAASPPRFFAWAAPAALAWMILSRLAAPPGERAPAIRAADLALGVATALLLYAGARAFLWALCGGLTSWLCAPMSAMFQRFQTRGALGAGLALLLLIGPAEELFWRGVVQARLAPRLGPLRAVAVTTSLAAALALATREPFLALATVPTYAAWGALAAWRRSLVPAVVSHALWSTLVATLAPPV